MQSLLPAVAAPPASAQPAAVASAAGQRAAAAGCSATIGPPLGEVQPDVLFLLYLDAKRRIPKIVRVRFESLAVFTHKSSVSRISLRCHLNSFAAWWHVVAEGALRRETGVLAWSLAQHPRSVGQATSQKRRRHASKNMWGKHMELRHRPLSPHRPDRGMLG
jgi:hypothetical protein